jgi:hypothetical protein
VQGAPWLTDLYDCLQGLPWAETVTERLDQISWVLDHLDDLDADFLAIYGIDLDRDDITARRYFALAHRLPAYTGVMAARVEAEREEEQPTRAASSTPTRTSSTPVTERGDTGVTEVSLTQFRAQFPGWVSVAQGG